MIDNSKRQFFKALKPKNISNTIAGKIENNIFPPYNSDQTLFLKHCYECKEKPCLKACPENIIEINDHLPNINFNKGGCTFCKDCANACDLNVLSLPNKDYINAKTNINEKTCLAWNYTICESCRDVCNHKAIDFEGLWYPKINKLCTNCGECYYICPAKAIDIVAKINI